MRNILRSLFIVAIAYFIFFPISNKERAQAQEPFQWSEPENLSNTPTTSNHQAIVTDGYGNVHVFWTEDVGGPELSIEEGESMPGNTIFYRRWDGESWSVPVDIIYGRGLTYGYLSAAVDENNQIYLVWMAFDGLHFSSAPALNASSAKNWLNDIVLEPSQGSRPFIIARGNGELDVLYDTTYQVGNFTKDGNLYHIRSVDGGMSWSTPLQISDIDPNSQTIVLFPHLARDGKGRLHAVWYVGDPPGYTGTAVFYSRSIDEGETWSEPLKIDEVKPEVSWSSQINIGVIGDNEIHLVWVCGQLPGRCHQMSQDGGDTWSPIRHVFGDLHSLANWDALIGDDQGNLYWVLQLRYPKALYYSYWTGTNWVDPPIILHSRDPYVSEGHSPELAIRNGNELHLIVRHSRLFEIWHMWAKSPLADPIPAQPTPVTLPTDIPGSTPNAFIPDTRPVSEVRAPQIGDLPEAASMRPDFSLMIGIASTILLLVVISLYQISGRHRK